MDKQKSDLPRTRTVKQIHPPPAWETDTDEDVAKAKERIQNEKRRPKQKKHVKRPHHENTNWSESCSCTSFSSDNCSCNCCCSNDSMSCSSDSDERFSKYYRLSSDEDDLRGVKFPKEAPKNRRAMTRLLLHTFTTWDDIWRSNDADDESEEDGFTDTSNFSDDEYESESSSEMELAGNKRRQTSQGNLGKNDSLSDVALSKKLKQTLILKQEHGVFFSGQWYGLPVEEVDPFLYDDTFCVLSYRPNGPCVAYRFYKGDSLGLFAPDHPIRTFAFKVVTHRYFGKFIIMTIFANCISLALERFVYDEYGKRYETSLDLPIAIGELVFLSIYSVEMILKVIAKGFLFQKMSYLRNGWNLLDFIVVFSNYISLTLEVTTTNDFDMEFEGTNFEFLRIFRVLRIVKVISILPRLRKIVTALLKSSKQLAEVMSLAFFAMMIFSILGMEFFSGKFRQKCVRIKGVSNDDDFVPDSSEITKGLSAHMTDTLYGMWVESEHNWLYRDVPDSEPIPCGNGSTARRCPEGFVCLEVVNSKNPNHGWISFDNFFMAMMQTLQTMNQDYWERIYEFALSTVGLEGSIYFVITIFFGGFYLLNLILAVVTQSYDKEQNTIDVNRSEFNLPVPKYLALTRQMSTFKFEHLNQQRLHLFEGFHNKSQRERDELLLRMIKADEFAHRKMAKGQFQTSQQFSHAVYKMLGRVDRYKLVHNKAEGEKEEMHDLNLHRKDIPEDGYYDEYMFFDGESDAELVDAKDTNCLLLKNGKKCNFGLAGFDQTFLVQDMSVFVQCPVKEPDFDLFPRINKWESLQAWLQIWSDATAPIVEDWKWKNFMILCIFINTVISCFDHFKQPYYMDYVIYWSNESFTYICCFELLLKIVAYQHRFFEYGWNKFDLCVVIGSVLDNIMQSLVGYKGLRGLKLLRILRLAQAWDTMKVLLNILFSAIGDMANLVLMLFFAIYIFAMFGMHYIGAGYTPINFRADYYPANYPRWAWQTVVHSCLMVFRVVSGEWIELIWECFDAFQEKQEEYKCLLVFIPMLILGNFILLNLFLALLLHIFDADQINSLSKSVMADRRERGNTLRHNLGRTWRKIKRSIWKKGEDNEEDEENPKRKTKLKLPIGFMRNKNKVKPEGAQDVDSHKSNLVFILKPKVEKVQEKYSSKTPMQLVVPRRYPKWRFYKVVHKYITVGDGNYHDSSEDEDLLDQPKQASKNEEDGNDEVQLKNERFRQAVCRVILKIRKQKIIRLIKKYIEIQQIKKKRAFLRSGPSKASQLASTKSIVLEEEEKPEPFIKPCFPESWYGIPICFCCWLWGSRSFTCLDNLRTKVLRLLTHNYFECFIMICIFGSSIMLCFDDIYIDDNYTLREVLFYSGAIFTGIFFIEFLLQIFAKGIYVYFTSLWTILDFIVVFVGILSLVADVLIRVEGKYINAEIMNQLGSLKALKTLRCLRPLRAISRWEGMRIVVNSLFRALPRIFNVFCVCIVFWLVFAIMGVQFFKGRFFKCVNQYGETVDPSIAPNKQVCCHKAHSHGFSWVNSFPNFDSVPQAYIALMYLATFEGWMDVIRSGTDARDVDQQPLRDYDIYSYIFFILFCLLGGFLTMKLFIGVIIDNFNMLKKQFEGNLYEALMSPSQLLYYRAIKKLGSKRPRIVLPKPTNPARLALFELAHSHRTEFVMFIVIFFNMIIMCCDGYDNSKFADVALESLNAFFIFVYTLEALVKLVGLGSYYFKSGWNVFDLVILIVSVVDYGIGDLLGHNFPIHPSIVRLCRILRVGRVMRLMKSAKGMRRLVFALFVSLPALFNVGALLILVMFIYSILGMTLFGNIGYGGAFDELINFETFPRAFFLLFRLITVAGWNDVLGTLMPKEVYCSSSTEETCGGDGQPDCVSGFVAITFVVTYLIITNFVIVNMYIAIILENFNQVNEEDDFLVTGDDIEIFFDKWAIFDGDATQFMELRYLAPFLDVLEPPLRMKHPNQIAITALDIPIYQGNLIQIYDVMRNLIVFVMGNAESSKMGEIQKVINNRFTQQFRQKRILPLVSTTRIWKIQHRAARIIQNSWRKYLLEHHRYRDPPVKIVFNGDDRDSLQSEHH